MLKVGEIRYFVDPSRISYFGKYFVIIEIAEVKTTKQKLITIMGLRKKKQESYFDDHLLQISKEC